MPSGTFSASSATCGGCAERRKYRNDLQGVLRRSHRAFDGRRRLQSYMMKVMILGAVFVVDIMLHEDAQTKKAKDYVQG